MSDERPPSVAFRSREEASIDRRKLVTRRRSFSGRIQTLFRGEKGDNEDRPWSPFAPAKERSFVVDKSISRPAVVAKIAAGRWCFLPSEPSLSEFHR